MPNTDLLSPVESDKLMRTLKLSLDRNPTVDLGVRNWIEERVQRSEETGKLVAEVHTLTPQLARELLTNNPGNRSVRPAKLQQIIGDIKDGHWRLNGESIIIASNGQLNDGQHRCLAVVEANTAIDSVFVFGVPADTRSTLDNGANRGAGDHLAIEGIKYALNVAATARWVLAYEAAGRKTLGNGSRISPSLVFERGLADKAIQDAAAIPYRHLTKSKKYAPPSVLSFCYYLFAKKSFSDAEGFIKQIVFGTDLGQFAPAYLAREKLIDNINGTREWRIEVIITAWNHYRNNDEIKALTVRGDKLPAIK